MFFSWIRYPVDPALEDVERHNFWKLEMASTAEFTIRHSLNPFRPVSMPEFRVVMEAVHPTIAPHRLHPIYTTRSLGRLVGPYGAAVHRAKLAAIQLREAGFAVEAEG